MSLDMTAFLLNIKQAAMEAVVASKPVSVVFGEVVSVSPLKVQIDQKLILTEAQLALTSAVRDCIVHMTVNHKTESASGGSGENAFAAHSHSYQGEKQFKVHLGLELGEKVLLLRADGGQKYIILDRAEALK